MKKLKQKLITFMAMMKEMKEWVQEKEIVGLMVSNIIFLKIYIYYEMI